MARARALVMAMGEAERPRAMEPAIALVVAELPIAIPLATLETVRDPNAMALAPVAEAPLAIDSIDDAVADEPMAMALFPVAAAFASMPMTILFCPAALEL